MNVLLLTDYSATAHHAHKYAFNLFSAKKQVNYFLLHSCHQIDNEAKEQNNEFKLKKDLKALNQLTAGKSYITPICSPKRLIDAIRECLKNHDIDLVVMGANGHSNNLTHQLGKNAKSTATKIKCPVLIVFNNCAIKIPHKVAFPVDYTDRLQESCIKKIKKLPASNQLEIDVFEINRNSTDSFLEENSKSILHRGLEKLKTSYVKDVNFNISTLKTKDNSSFDLISFAAKNLSVNHIIFDQLRELNSTFNNHPPLYILHA